MKCKELKNNYLILISKLKGIEKKIASLNKVIAEFSTDFNKLNYLDNLFNDLVNAERLKKELKTEIEKLITENKFLNNV